MVIVLCQCDWGLGANLPAHEHAVLSLVRPTDRADKAPMWFRSFIPQRGWEVLAEVEELLFNVPWKQLAREAVMA